MLEFYVYVKFRPWNGIPCYVGKGSGDRAFAHERNGSCNSHLQKIIEKAGGEVPTVIVRAELSEEDAFFVEMSLIKAIGRGKRGPLVNMTDGGEGFSGGRHSPESREAIGNRTRGKKQDPDHTAKISAALKGRRRKPFSLERRLKLSASLKSSSAVAANIKRIADLYRGKPHSAEHNARSAAARIGQIRTPEMKIRMSEAQRARFRKQAAYD